MSKAYYNEIDPFAAEWLRNLIFHGLIADGDVDERSIEDVRPSDLKGYTQCHFFAGIGVWSLALRNAGWRDDEPVWTGSCPCQPFSAAGKRKGIADDRHLWPAWKWLIEQCRPRVVFGEQVASKDGRAWIDAVQTDLETMGFAVGAGDICAAGAGAPHIRQRLYFVADADDEGLQGRSLSGADIVRRGASELAVRSASVTDRIVGNAVDEPRQRRAGNVHREKATLNGERLAINGPLPERPRDAGEGMVSFWSTCDWLPCIDGKARPVEPGTFPLVNGAPARVGRLRAYGNALVEPCAQAFIEAYLGK